MKNKTYDRLKWIALTALPGLAFFYLTVADIWNLPYPEEIAATITAIDTLLGTLLGLSSIKYAKNEEGRDNNGLR